MRDTKDKSKKEKEKSARKWIDEVYRPWYEKFTAKDGDSDEGENPPGPPPPPPPDDDD